MKRILNIKNVLYCILCGFIFLEIFYLVKQNWIAWDSAVYVGMGKYIFSLGKIGLWEPARPLIWPVVLGFVWKIKLNPLIYGRILELILSIGCVYLTYLIGKEVFNEKIGLLSALFLAFSPTFLFYSSSVLTDIPSTFFCLLGVYSFIRKKGFLSGIFFALAFLTRYLQLFAFIGVIVMPLLFTRKGKIKKLKNIVLGFLVMTVPFLIINLFVYKNPLYPFLFQIFMTKNTGWIFDQPFSFYFVNLIKENFLVLFLIIGFIIILKRMRYKECVLLVVFLIFFLFFNSIAHKEMRFTIVFLPYTYLIMVRGIFEVLRFMKKKRRLCYFCVMVVGVVWIFLEVKHINFPSYGKYGEFHEYLEDGGGVKDGVWISNPIFIVKSDKRADILIYYPLYNSRKAKLLQKELWKANHILLDTCDILPCPKEDKDCFSETNNLLSPIQKDFELFYHNVNGNCEQFIFRR